MSLSPSNEKSSPLDEKVVDDIQVEHVAPPGGILGGEIDVDGVRKSAFDELRIWDTVKIFKRATFYCFICYSMSMLDGWSVSWAIGPL